jgi:hypothetical protein
MGAGTGRLAWQIAIEFSGFAPVLALDINPLPFIVTALLLSGENVALSELPAHPRKSTMPFLTRTLSCALAPAPSLCLALADALDPPVARGRWQTVVAPWFVDEVPENAALVPELVSSLLVEGGSFICTGPFLYDSGHTKSALRYCADEFVELVKHAGFEVTTATYEPEPYMVSPISTQGRIEHVLYLHARKDSSRRVARRELPAFLTPAGAEKPIPRPTGIQNTQFSPPEVAEVAALIDGERSVQDITVILIERGVLVNDGTQESGVRGCLRAIFERMKAT